MATLPRRTESIVSYYNASGDLSANITGAPQSCAAIDANNLATGMTVAGLPGLDLPVLNDSNALFTIKCQ